MNVHESRSAGDKRTPDTRLGRKTVLIVEDNELNMKLPEVSGLEVTKWLKEDDDLRTIPVVAITAFAMKGDEERIRSGGCEAYISKPISVNGFLETVHRFVGDPRA